MTPLDIPGVREAIEREKRARDLAFMPLTERIGPFEVRQMTLCDLLTLRTLKSPLLSGESPSAADLKTFLWVLSPENDSPSARQRRRFLRRCRAFTIPPSPVVHFPWLMKRWSRRAGRSLAMAAHVLVEAREYLDETFQDAPPKPTGIGYQASYYSDVCGLCAIMGREYGYSAKDVLAMPLKALFQFQIERRNFNGGRINFNPSDLVIQKTLSNCNN